ncbi:MAG: hypothetical protein M0R17_00570 [Candidatus Omnitrophica bacterium]|jgi:hypothetical protein|nr:hypothetical protein [Candidatus Omnitrophota bacterium]
MIVANDIKKINTYFNIASAYIPNQFDVFIRKRGLSDTQQYNGNNTTGTNPLYLINKEPWVVENITLPQIKFKQANDIYMSQNSLLRPNYILEIETSGLLTLTVREKSDLAIYRSLIRCQSEIFNGQYESSGNNLIGQNYSIEITTKTQRHDAIAADNGNTNRNIFADNVIKFDRCLLTNISDPVYAYDEINPMMYIITFEISSMAESYKDLVGDTKGSVSLKNPSSSLGTATETTISVNAGKTSLDSYERVNSSLPIANTVGNNVAKSVNTGITGAISSYNPTIKNSDIKAPLVGFNLTQSASDVVSNTATNGIKNTTGITNYVLRH